MVLRACLGNFVADHGGDRTVVAECTEYPTARASHRRHATLLRRSRQQHTATSPGQRTTTSAATACRAAETNGLRRFVEDDHGERGEPLTERPGDRATATAAAVNTVKAEKGKAKAPSTRAII